MTKTPADIFRSTSDLESFRREIIALDGNFPFEEDDMIALGEWYFERYPDSFSNRNSSNVLFGYQIVRICILEKALAGFDQDVKQLVRKIFFSISAVDDCVKKLHETSSIQVLSGIYEKLSIAITNRKVMIDSIPVGMIKERYIGGITNFYNILYLFKSSIDRIKPV